MATIRPTLIVGIGTTGLEMLEDLENLWIITFGKKMPSIFKLVVLETNRTCANATPLGDSQIQVINVGQANIQQAKNIVSQTLGRNPFWLDGVERIAQRPLEVVKNSTAGGSYHIRALGRQSLWASWQAVSGTLTAALNQINPATNPPGFAEAGDFFNRFGDTVHNDPVAYVVGSSGGGTGSGVFIDVGHYLYDRVNGNVLGILLLPVQGSTLNLAQIDGQAKLANTHATLQELLFYFDQRTCCDFEDLRWPDNLTRMSGIPYQVLYLEGSLQAGRRFEELERIIAFRLFLGLLGLTHHVLAGGLGGAGLGALRTWFVTSGLTAFYHPRREIVEASGSILGVQLIRKLTVGNEEEAKKEMRAWVSDVLEKGLEKLSGTTDQPEDDIQREVGRFKGGELSNLAQLEAALAPKFSGQYPGIFDGHFPAVSAEFERELDAKLKGIANQKKSLKWAEDAAKVLPVVIDEVLAHWKEIGVPENDASLPETVRSRFKDLKEVGSSVNPFDFGSHQLGKYYEVIHERLFELLKLIKAYKLRRALIELRSHSASQSQNIETKIKILENGVRLNLRTDPIRKKLHIVAGAGMLLPVYATDTMENDVRETIGNVIGPHVNGIPLEFEPDEIDAFLYAAFAVNSQAWIPDNIWDIDYSSEERNIALNIKVNLIGHNRLNTKVPDVNVANVAQQRVADAVNLANSAENGFLNLNQNMLGAPTYVIKSVLGRDNGNLQPLVANPALQPLDLQVFASGALMLMITLIEPPMIGLMEPPKRGHFVVPDGFKF